MKEILKYNIDIFKLGNKQHRYAFESGDSFFADFEQDLLKKGHFRVELLLDKSATLLHLHFHVVGSVELVCDRSLEPFTHPIEVNQSLILKYGEENRELTDEIEVIVRDTPRINVAQYIFEYIGLSLPMKKIHPSLRDQPVEYETEEALLIYRSEDIPENAEEDDPSVID
ncbi:MAG: DUF177 domain-containing protein, partial [Ferruginibacter sp.]|nr:DUF177 domain-containing protein [Cytophagales bacterium]